MMKCSEIQEQFNDYLETNLSEVANSEILIHLNTCENCCKELEEFKSFLNILDNDKMELPSANLRLNFEQMLAKEIEENQTKIAQLQPKKDWKTYLRVAASVLVVCSAFLLGKYQRNHTTSTEKQTAQVLLLLKNDSASKRILAVTNTEEFTNKDTKIIKALIDRLFFDKNTNVRLAAAEALSQFSSDVLVRDALIKSLQSDKKALVQIEVIGILSKIKEKRAVEPMQKMLENEETPQYVKQQLQLNLSSLL